MGGGQWGSGLDKTVSKISSILKHSQREPEGYFSFLNGSTTPKIKKGLLIEKHENLGEGEDITAERLPSNRAFLYYTQSCVPSEADSGK